MKKAVVITGVSGGIGWATAELFKSNCWLVIGIDLQEPSGDRQLLDTFIQADVSNPAAWTTVSEKIKTCTSTISTLVNNAAVQVCKPLIETDLQEWNHVISVNLTSIYLGIRALESLMQTKETAIVNVSSVHALATSTQIAAYAASKGGVVAMTRALALELAPRNIRVNAVLPGAVDTPMLRSGLSRGHVRGNGNDELVQALGKKHLRGQVGKPEEIAKAIFFLSDSQYSSFITGQNLVVDGGATIRLSTE